MGKPRRIPGQPTVGSACRCVTRTCQGGFGLSCCVRGYTNLSFNKVHTHCYETVDLDDFVRVRNVEVVAVVLEVLTKFELQLTNEFQFPLAAFHHAHETYLVPGALKQ